jgi:phosphopantetheinyl transferase (holo-ACP synthase)
MHHSGNKRVKYKDIKSDIEACCQQGNMKRCIVKTVTRKVKKRYTYKRIEYENKKTQDKVKEIPPTRRGKTKQNSKAKKS